MQIYSCFIIISIFLFSCNSADKVKGYEDPGTPEGRARQVCDCLTENEGADEQECYDLNNKYYKMMNTSDQEIFSVALVKCKKGK